MLYSLSVLVLLATPQGLVWTDIETNAEGLAPARVFELKSSQVRGFERLAAAVLPEGATTTRAGNRIAVVAPQSVLNHLTAVAQAFLKESAPSQIHIFAVEPKYLQIAQEASRLTIGSEREVTVDGTLGLLVFPGTEREGKLVEEMLLRLLELRDAGPTRRPARVGRKPRRGTAGSRGSRPGGSAASVGGIRRYSPGLPFGDLSGLGDKERQGNSDLPLRPILAEVMTFYGLSFSRFPSATRKDTQGAIEVSQKLTLEAAPMSRVLKFAAAVADSKDSVQLLRLELRPEKPAAPEADLWVATVEFRDYEASKDTSGPPPAPAALDYADALTDLVGVLEHAKVPLAITRLDLNLGVLTKKNHTGGPAELVGEKSALRLMTTDAQAHVRLETAFRRKESRYFRASPAARPHQDGFRIELMLTPKREVLQALAESREPETVK